MREKLLILSLISVFILTSCDNLKKPDILQPITEKPYSKIIGIKIEPPSEITFYTDGEMTAEEKKFMAESFLTAVVIPEKDLWVNLRIEQLDRIVPYSLGVTELGKIMLEQDYLLKKATSTAYYPGNDSGYKFWNRIEFYGPRSQTDIRSWIYPKSAIIVDNGREMFIKKAELGVKQEKIREGIEGFQESSDEIILPVVKDYVLRDEHFIPIRQAYRAVICGIWFKNKFINTIYHYCINTNKTGAFEIADTDIKYKVRDKYVDSYKNKDYKDFVPSKNRIWGGVDFKKPAEWVAVEKEDTKEKLKNADRFKIALTPSSVISSNGSGEVITKGIIGGIDLDARIKVEQERFDVSEETARNWQFSQSIGYILE